MKKVAYILVCIFTLLFGGYFSIAYLLPLTIPPLPYSTVLLDTDEQEIGEIIASGSIRHRAISFGEIPEFYIRSLIHLEDRSFYSNNGVDLRGIVRSTIHNIEAGKTIEGASTLSSGLIRNTLWLNEDRSFSRKILEFLAAIRLNHLYSKDEILTLYADRISFGYLNYGLASSAEYYFDKEPKNLTKAEQIALLAIPKNPKTYDPYVHPKTFRTRFEAIVSTLKDGGIISGPEADSILSEKLVFNTHHENTLPYVVDFIKKTIVENQNP